MAFGFYDESVSSVALPHPPISVTVHLVLEEALRTAWNRLRTQPRAGFDLLNAHENVVTQELYEVLFDDVFGKGIVPGFDRELFTTGNREAKLRNYNGDHLDKMPDLTIELIGRPSVVKYTQDRLFIECKPVDANHTVGVEYCNKGILRFVRGDYAWTMTSALMVGYVTGNYTILPKLADALSTRQEAIPTSSFPQGCHRSQATMFSETVHITEHFRTFCYVETGKAAPHIVIRHLWLQRDYCDSD